MDGKIAEALVLLAREVGAGVFVPYKHPLFRPASVRRQDLSLQDQSLNSWFQLQPDGLGVSTVCTRCGARKSMTIGLEGILGEASLVSLTDPIREWTKRHEGECSPDQFVGFSDEVLQALAEQASAISRLMYEGHVVPAHLLVLHRDGRRRLVQMDYFDGDCSEGEIEQLTQAVHTVLRHELRIGGEVPVAVAFVSRPLPIEDCPDGKLVLEESGAPLHQQKLLISAVDGTQGLFAFAPVLDEGEPLKWFPTRIPDDVLDGILVEDVAA